jgi:hypothetical protein
LKPSVFGSKRLTGALLDRLTHHVHILETNGESFRLATGNKAEFLKRLMVGAPRPIFMPAAA